MVLSTGEEFDSELIVWAAGNAANPVVAQHTDLPVDDRGFLRVRADLRVGTARRPCPTRGPPGTTPPSRTSPSAPPGRAPSRTPSTPCARAGTWRRTSPPSLRGGTPRDYVHQSLGVVATLGLGQGVFQYRRLVIKGFPAWVMHRGYHVLAVPTWERKIRVLAVWLAAAVFGRDIVSLAGVQHPRDAFVRGGAPR